MKLIPTLAVKEKHETYIAFYYSNFHPKAIHIKLPKNVGQKHSIANLGHSIKNNLLFLFIERCNKYNAAILYR